MTSACVTAPRLARSAHRRRSGAIFVRAPVRPIGGDREDDPAEIVEEAAAEHGPTRYRPDRGAIEELVEVICDFRMNRELSKVSGRLNPDDPDICAPDATTGGANEANMMPRMQIVFREDRPPASIIHPAFAGQDRRIPMRLHETRPRAPDVEIAVAACLEPKKHRKQH